MIVERFLTWVDSAPAQKKARAASALARAYLLANPGSERAESVETAITVLLDDPDDSVRQTLADLLADSEKTPRHIVMALANDKPQIALPVLARSPVFCDSELIDIAGTGSVGQQIAIACRTEVSAAVSAAIVEAGPVQAAYALLSNEKVRFAQATLHAIARRHGLEDEIRKLLIARDDLSVETRLVVIDHLGELMRRKLQEDEVWMPPARVEALVREHSDKAVIAFASNVSDDDLPSVVATLIDNERLSAAFLLRAICLGNISLFGHALSRLSCVPLKRVETVLGENRRSAFRALYMKSGLPDRAFEVFAATMEAWRKALAAREKDDEIRKSLPCLVTEEVLSSYKPSGDAQVDSLYALLRKIAAETARDSAKAVAARIADEARERDRILLESPKAVSPEEQFPIIDMPDAVISHFALHFAEELVDLEAGLRAEEAQVAQMQQVDPVDVSEPIETVEHMETIEAKANISADVQAPDVELNLAPEPDEPSDAANDDIPGVAAERPVASLLESLGKNAAQYRKRAA